jgi:CDP-diacylglycerol--glycerol-3-phosphate 3-phosphatidyltransferase
MACYDVHKKERRKCLPLEVLTQLSKPSGQKFKFAFNVPNTLTTLRVVLAIVIACLLVLGSKTQILAAGLILIVASITDFFDGFLARRLGQSSLLGSLFDVVADEILFMPSLILAIAAGLFARTNGLMPLNPYLYAVPALAGGVTVLVGVGIYLWKSRRRTIEFPTPTKVAKLNYWFWQAPLIIAILGIGPDILLAVLMYIALISTILTFYSYLKKGSYVFTD